MNQMATETVNVRIKIERLASSDLMVATSADLPGLTVHGRSFEEIIDLLPSRIEDIVSFHEKQFIQAEIDFAQGYTSASEINAHYTYLAA